MNTEKQEYLNNRREVLIENMVFDGFAEPEIELDKFYEMLNAVVEDTKKLAKPDSVIKVGISESKPFLDSPAFVVYSTRWETEDEYKERKKEEEKRKNALTNKDKNSIKKLKELIEKYPDFAELAVEEFKKEGEINSLDI